jgi:hypothetical protein
LRATQQFDRTEKRKTTRKKIIRKKVVILKHYGNVKKWQD